MQLSEIHFCPRCGTQVIWAERFGRQRPVCPQCDWVFFPDPKVAAAALVLRGDDVLFVRRVNEPFRGLWTLPAGFVDAGEDPAAAAQRECLEETGLHVRVERLLDVIAGQEHARGAHILIVYLCSIEGGDLQPGDDADGAAFFSTSHLPPLAFASTTQILKKITQKSS